MMRSGCKWKLARAPLAVLACLGLAGIAAAEADQIYQVSSEVCKTCHQDVYRQWSGSMHSKSTALTDPIHGAFYQQVVGDPTKEGVLHKASGKYPVCLQCHAPNAARDKTTKLDAKPAYSEGVNCVACHTLAKYKGIKGPGGKLQLGLKAYEVSNELQGPAGMGQGLKKLTASGDMFGGAVAGAGDSQKPNPHLGEPVEIDGKKIPALPMEANPLLMQTNDACMGCHDQRSNPNKVPLCQTGDEYIAGGGNVTCVSCHMPINDGVADHTMGGGHNSAVLKRSVVFGLTAKKEGKDVVANVMVKNQQPHSLPTGAPFRNMYVKVTAYNDQGEVVWENAKGHPGTSDPQSYFVYVLADAKGHLAPPPTATGVAKDTRLKAWESRTLKYDIPAKGVVLVRAELYYSLLWPSLAKKFTKLPENLRTPVLVAESETAITAGKAGGKDASGG